MIIYGLGTTIASLSHNLGTLIVGWSLLEGIGGALMIPNIQVILRDAYKGSELAYAYGIIGAVGAVGAAVGPIVGGFFTTYFSWRWAFRTELLIVIIVLVLSRSLKPDNLTAEKPQFDFAGALLSIFGWASIVLGILLAQTYGFFLAKQPFLIGSYEFVPLGLSITPVLVGLGFLLIIMLFQWEQRLENHQKDGLFKPSIFHTPGILSGFAVRFIQVGITAAFLYILPLLLQLSFEYTAMETGVALMPFSLSLLVLAIVGARLSSRFTAKRIIQVGFILAILGLSAVAASITPNTTPSELVLGGLFGGGLGLIASQILNLILSSVTAAATAEAAGLTSTFEQLGNSIGVALVGTIMLGTLSILLQSEITNSTSIPLETKQPLINAAEDSVQLMSSSQLQAALETAGADPLMIQEIDTSYSQARTQAFKAGVGLLIFASILGLVFTFGLSNRKLVAETTA